MSDTPTHSIAARLARRILLYASACALLIGGVQTLHLSQEVRQRFSQSIEAAGLTHVPLLSVAVWDIEPDTIRRQLHQLASQHAIGHVRLVTDVGRVFEAGDPDARDFTEARRFDVPNPTLQGEPIGTLEIVADTRAFYRELATTIGVGLLGYAVLTLLMCGLVLVALRRELGPLRHIAEFVKTLSPERLTTPLTVDRGPRHQRDEIDLVVEGFEILQRGIDSHIRNLDHQVAARTHDLEAALASIRTLSTTDTLTGCFNRRLFDERIADEVERADRYGRPLSIVFADADHFKRINDTWGHNAGDEVLRAFSASLKAQVRDHIDWVVRYGGEEFVIVLPETTLDRARALAERIRVVVESEPLTIDDRPIRLTASFGVAQYAPGEALADWIDRADKWLYLAKEQGRNRVCG